MIYFIYEVDSLIGFKYNSRYYNPVWGRFINADSMLIQDNNMIGYNLYTYAVNNPINLSGTTGNWPKWIKDIGKAIDKTIKKVVSAVKKVVDDVKKSFVFEAGVGLGLDISVSPVIGGKAGYLNDMTYKYENNEVTYGSSISYGAEFGISDYKIALTGDVFHEYHNVKGDVYKSIIPICYRFQIKLKAAIGQLFHQMFY